MIIPIEKFGKDHWSTLLYVESCAVDRGGRLDDRKMRTYQYGAKKHYHTYLANGEICEDEKHDDWSCLQDMCYAGLLYEPEWGEFELKHTSTIDVKLTDYGWYIAGRLRRHRAEGVPDREFVAPPNPYQ